MTEEWDRCADPLPMLESLLATDRPSERKWRLFAVACCRRVWHLLTEERSRQAVDVAERFVEGDADREELMAAYTGAFAVFATVRGATPDRRAADPALAVTFAARGPSEEGFGS